MSAHPSQPHEHTRAAEEKAKEKDPHGTAPAGKAAEADAAAYPNDHRKQSETAGGTGEA